MFLKIKNLKLQRLNTFYIIIFIGIFARLFFSQFGNMIDFEAWALDLDVYKLNGNLYESGKYNYGPVWINILYFLDLLPNFYQDAFLAFKYKVVLFLTLMDILLFNILFQRYSLRVATFFFLNPISIYVSGYQLQFDNIAVLIGLIAVIIYNDNKNFLNFLNFLLLIGISLCTKHILFFFIIWAALKEKKWIRKVLCIIIPVSVFLIGFIPFYDQVEFIKQYVFLYKSWDNSPFWHVFTPQFFRSYLGGQNLFFIALFICGFIFHKENIFKSYLLYLIALVTFSSAVANQYLAIPLIAIAIYWNRFFLIYTILSFSFFLIDYHALNIEVIIEFISWSERKNRIAYKLIIFFLSIGFLESIIGKKKIDNFLKYIISWVYKNIKNQFKN